MKKILVIGNGESRLKINIDNINLEKIGCNACIRDFYVDHLVCIDKKPLQEALKIYQGKIYTRPEYIRLNSNLLEVPKIPYPQTIRPDFPEHWGSGPYAILLAALNFDEINIIGFDLWGIEGKVNNIYKDTNNYVESNHRAIDPRYWIYQISKIFLSYPDKYFILYNREDWKMPESWILPNVEFKPLDKLQY
jgi:hypothetical protein